MMKLLTVFLNLVKGRKKTRFEDETEDERIKSLFSEEQLAEMQEHFSPAVRVILSQGVQLLSSGINNYALTYEQALIALNELLDIGTGVWGAEIMERDEDGQITYSYFIGEFSYDAWAATSLPKSENGRGESQYGFAKRSIPQAREFIHNFFGRDKSYETRYWVMLTVA